MTHFLLNFRYNCQENTFLDTPVFDSHFGSNYLHLVQTCDQKSNVISVLFFSTFGAILAPFWDPVGGRFGDFWCRRGRLKRKSRFFENVVFLFVFKAKMQVGGPQIETIWHPWDTFSTFGNDVGFQIDFGSQK